MSVLIDAHVAHLKAAGYSPKTIYGRTRILHRLDAELPGGLDSPHRSELTTWFAAWTGWTLYTYWEAAYTFYAWASAGREPYLEWNPMDELTRPRTPRRDPRPATEEQVAQALAELYEPFRTGVLLAAAQGLRCAEICGLDRDDITPSDLYVTRKGAKLQVLPIHPDVWYAVRTRRSGPLVRNGAGRRWNPGNYSTAVSEALGRIGLDLTLHRFRARFATHLHDQGVNIRVIQELMGHASIATTEGYIKVKDEQRRLAISTLLVPTGPQLEAA